MMHKSGKILIFFVAALPLLAIYFAVSLFKVQNSWATKAARVQEQIATSERTLQEKTAQLQDLQAALDRETIVWDRYWTGVRATVAPDGRIMTENLGRNQGLGGFDAENRPAPIVHLFGQTANGGSVYVGSFAVTDLREQQAMLEPSQFLAHSPQQLSQFTLWRVRTRIPQSHRDRLTKVHNALIDTQRLLADKQRHLKTQEQIIADSQKVRDARLRELNGDQSAGQPGLVAQIQQIEAERNQELADLDRLRREVHGLQERIAALVEQNEYLARTLPGSPQVVSQQTAR